MQKKYFQILQDKNKLLAEEEQQALARPLVHYRLEKCKDLQVEVTGVGDPGSDKEDNEAWDIEKLKHSAEALDRKVTKFG